MNLLCVFALVKLVSPINDTEVRLIDTEIERVMSLPTYENRQGLAGSPFEAFMARVVACCLHVDGGQGGREGV